MIIILSILAVIQLSFNIGLYIALNKSMSREKKILNMYEDFYSSIYDKISISLNRMREVDRMQIFEKDDDVGVVFSNLSKIMEELNEKE